MLTIYNSLLDKNERKRLFIFNFSKKNFNFSKNILFFWRIEKIEWFDELEEWNIMQAHYFVSLVSVIDKEKRKAIEENDEEKIKYKELLDSFGFHKQ